MVVDDESVRPTFRTEVVTDAEVGLWLDVVVECSPHLFQQPHVLLAVTNHLVQCRCVVPQNESIPEIVVFQFSLAHEYLLPQLRATSVQLLTESEDFGDIGQFVRGEVKLMLGLGIGVDADVIRHHGNMVCRTASANPRDVELITVVGDEFVSPVRFLDKLLQHPFLVVLLVPCQVVNFALTFQLVTDADDAPRNDDVVEVHSHPVVGFPEPPDVWTDLDVEDESAFVVHFSFHCLPPLPMKQIVTISAKRYEIVRSGGSAVTTVLDVVKCQVVV